MSQTVVRLLAAAMAAVGAAAGGCSGPASEADHHLEHVTPAHKPNSFGEAIAELEIRGKSLASKPAAAGELAELSDIIEWLPELAADSDLRRQQWEQVRKTSRDLAAIVRRAGETTATSTDQETWAQSVAVLQKLVPHAGSTDPWGTNSADSHHDDHGDHGDSPADRAETGR